MTIQEKNQLEFLKTYSYLLKEETFSRLYKLTFLLDSENCLDGVKRDLDFCNYLKISKRCWSSLKKELMDLDILSIVEDKRYKINPEVYMASDYNYYEGLGGLYTTISGSYDGEGLYILLLDGVVVYIGKSKNIKNRVREHRRDKNFNEIHSIIFRNDGDIDLYEPFLINKYKPKYNNDLIREFSSDILPEIILI